MADGAVTIQLKGFRELGEALALLNADVQLKVARSATNAAAQVVKKIAQRKAPVAKEDYIVRSKKGDKGVLVPKGNLPRKIAVKYLGKQTDLTSEHIVFVKAKRKDGYANRIGILKEFGTVKDAPSPFMRPALAEGADPAIEAMRQKLKERIDKANSV